MKRCGALLALAVVAGIVILGPATPAHAVLQMKVFVNGAQVNGTFTDNGIGDTNAAIGQMDITTAVNALITQFQFTTLGASSNSTVIGAITGLLTQTANVQTTPGFNAGGTLDIQATDTGYTNPASPSILTSTAAITTGNAAGVTRTFESWYNPPPPAPFGMVFPAPLITQTPGSTDSLSDTTMASIPPPLRGTPFGLTNETFFNVPAGNNHNVQTTGTTIVSTPEPATIVMALAGLPLLAVRAWRKRRALP